MARHFTSMHDVAQELHGAADRTFVHRWQDPSLASQLPAPFRLASWDHPGRSGESVAPKYLYRGESSVFPSSTPSRARIGGVFDESELAMLDELSSMASWVWRMRFGDPFRSLGWPQHYDGCVRATSSKCNGSTRFRDRRVTTRVSSSG